MCINYSSFVYVAYLVYDQKRAPNTTVHRAEQLAEQPPELAAWWRFRFSCLCNPARISSKRECEGAAIGGRRAKRTVTVERGAERTAMADWGESRQLYCCSNTHLTSLSQGKESTTQHNNSVRVCLPACLRMCACESKSLIRLDIQLALAHFDDFLWPFGYFNVKQLVACNTQRTLSRSRTQCAAAVNVVLLSC